MLLNSYITHFYNHKMLPHMGIMKSFCNVYGISLLKCNQVKSFNNPPLKMTLSPDASQKEVELKGLIKVYNQYQRADAVCLPGISYSQLAEFLGISYKGAKKVWSTLSKEMASKKIPSFYLTENVDLFNNYKINMKDSNGIENLLSLIKMPPVVTEARLDVLKETKIKMTYRNFKSISTIGKQTMEVLEFSDVLIPNLPQRIFENLNAPDHVLNSLPPPEIYRQMTFTKLWVDLQQILLNWKLSSEDDNFEILPIPIQLVKVHISLLNLTNNISMFKNEFKFSTQKIISNSKILTCHWSNLKKYASASNPELRSFISKVPEILVKPYEGSLQIQAMLHYISEDRPLSESCGYVFVLSSFNVLKRMEKLIKTTSLTDLRLTPNYGWLIYKIDKCFNNLDEKLMKEYVKCFPAVRLLEKAKGSFHNRKSAILLFLKDILGLSVTLEDLRLMNMVTLPELPCVKKNYVFLHEKEFPLKEIKDAYHILLFPHSIIVENFINMESCSYAKEFRKSNDKSKLLQLLIYYSSIHYKNIGGSY